MRSWKPNDLSIACTALVPLNQAPEQSDVIDGVLFLSVFLMNF
jgi:hypothetical protein